MKKIFPLLIAFLLSLACSACAADAASPVPGGTETAETVSEPVDTQIFAMDTFMELRAYGGSAQSGLNAVAGKIEELDALLSVTDENSEVYAINHSEGAPVSLFEDTATLLQKALSLSEEVGDSLEITLYPVSQAWGFTTGSYRVPDEAELSALLALVDDGQVALSGDTVTLPTGAELDFGAFAKGYAGDVAAAMLRESGVDSALLNLGGSTIRAMGEKPDGSLWNIAIQDPEDSSKYAGIVAMGEGAVNTSGGYERYFEEKGEVYWHILDPQTGSPAKNGLISATVLSDEAFLGDGLSTALFVMGPERAEAYWREHGDFEMILIGDDHRLYISEGADSLFTPVGDYEDADITILSREE